MDRYVGIAVYPLSSIPKECLLDPPQSYPSERPGFSSRYHLDRISYKVRDKGHICNAHVSGTKINPSSNASILLDLDFTTNEQSCSAIKASFLSEERSGEEGGGVVQVSFHSFLLKLIA